jgi:hypothetical protein
MMGGHGSGRTPSVELLEVYAWLLKNGPATAQAMRKVFLVSGPGLANWLKALRHHGLVEACEKKQRITRKQGTYLNGSKMVPVWRAVESGRLDDLMSKARRPKEKIAEPITPPPKLNDSALIDFLPKPIPHSPPPTAVRESRERHCIDHSVNRASQWRGYGIRNIYATD